MIASRRARVLILAPNAPGQGPGGAERHLQDLAILLEPLCDGVLLRSRADAPPPGWGARILAQVEPMLASPLATSRLVRQGLPDADVVLSVELMGVGLRHPGHLHLFFGSYAGFRDMALPPTNGPHALARGLKNRVARLLERRTQGPLGAIANSSGLRDEFRARGIAVRDEVVPPPTDCDRFAPGDRRAARAQLGLPPDQRVILFAGRWEYAKGADRCTDILKAMPTSWHLVIATPAGHNWPIPREPNVTVLTDLDTDQMIAAYRAADTLVQPSRFEGYSLVASEAQACGCPVLTSKVGHAFHFLSSEHPLVRESVIADADNVHSWLSKLQNILGDDQSQCRYSREHRLYAEGNVSYPAVQRAWKRILSETYTGFSWHPR